MNSSIEESIFDFFKENFRAYKRKVSSLFTNFSNLRFSKFSSLAFEVLVLSLDLTDFRIKLTLVEKIVVLKDISKSASKFSKKRMPSFEMI
jgi:hypothetical protein